LRSVEMPQRKPRLEVDQCLIGTSLPLGISSVLLAPGHAS
jgi:hypothetical protein